MDDAMPMPKKPKKAPKIEDYEVESAMNDMMRVEKHKQNPALMKKVHALAGRHAKQLKGIRSIADLKKARNEMNGVPQVADTDEDQE